MEGKKPEHTPTGPLAHDNVLNTKVSFQQEDKKKADARKEARIATKRTHI
jgi:hypothetical protein